MANGPGIAPVNTLTFTRGTSKTLELTVTDAAGTIVDLSGSKVVFTLKDDAYNPLPLVQKTTDDPTQAELTEPRLGKARIYLSPADTQNLDPVTYVYDVWVVLGSGKRYAVIAPTDLTLTMGVTMLPL